MQRFAIEFQLVWEVDTHELGTSSGLNPSQTRSLISSPAFRRMFTASWWVAPKRDWPLTSIILWPTLMEVYLKLLKLLTSNLITLILLSFEADFNTEYSFICRIQRVPRLSTKSSLDDHAKLLALFLDHAYLHKSRWKRIMLNSQLHDLAMLQQSHHSFLMADTSGMVWE